jgi:hypothetical protein
MNSFLYFDRKRPPQSSHQLGTIVFCIHCFETLGRDTPATPREILIARHTCVESQLARRPAAPPPYN